MSRKFLYTSFGKWELNIVRNMPFWHQWLSGYGHFHFSKKFGITVNGE